MREIWQMTAESGERVTVECELENEGSPVVLYLHGFGSSQGGHKAVHFRSAARGAGLGFCSLDFRGHGSSGGSMLDLTVSRCLEDVERVYAELRRRTSAPVVLLGSSFGALVGLWFAAQDSQRVAAASFIAPAIGIDRKFASELGREGMERWRREGRLTIEHELGATDLGWGFAEDFDRYPVDALARQYRVPSLVLQGMLDDRVDWREVVEFAAASGAEVQCHLFSRGDHRLVEQLEHVWRLMREFFHSRDLL